MKFHIRWLSSEIFIHERSVFFDRHHLVMGAPNQLRRVMANGSPYDGRWFLMAL
jgi:hypothetical protein